MAETDFLEKMIREAGQLCLDYRAKQSELQIDHKNDRDLVTEADQGVEQFIVDQIGKLYPEDGVFGEEGGESASSNGRRWIIDPIDGTTSFVHGQHYFSVSIALEEDGVVTEAAVFAPSLDELFMASKGQGAYLNGQPIQPSKRDRLIDSVLSTGFACVRAQLPENNLPAFSVIMPKLRGIRRYGSAAVDLCYVACGRLEGFWEMNLNLYDIAAGKLILEEAGGMYTDYDGAADQIPWNNVATNGCVHQELLDVLKAV